MTMNGTTTHGGGRTRHCSMMQPECNDTRWALVMTCLWDNWSIQLSVLLGLIFQTILAVLGSRRKTSSGDMIRFVIWASYLLTSYFAMQALSKLSIISPSESKEEYDTEVKALLAPLILLLLGNPDSITAYSVEDNRLGVRLVLNLVNTFFLVVWIVWQNGKTSIPMVLYFPILVAGIIKYGETIWALYNVYEESTNMRKEDFNEQDQMFSKLKNFHVPGLDIFLKAYYRFDCLKPHLVDWLKQPFFMAHRNMLIEDYTPKDVLFTTDMELGFMYDVLYTKAPVLFTKRGIVLRVISYFSLLLTLGGFMVIIIKQHLRDPHVISTFGLLIGVVLLETYQLLKLFFSDWMIIMNRNRLENPMVLKFLKFLVKRSLKKKRWSDRIRQLNFLDLCQSNKRPWFFKILKVCCMAEKFRTYSALSSLPIPADLKELLLEDITKFETKRGHQPFTKRGEWSLGIHESLDKLEWSIEMPFDRSIMLWHIATYVCYHSCHENSKRKEASKLISDYMMFLLVQHPQRLSLTTAEITYRHAYMNLKTLSNKFPGKDVLKVLLGSEPMPAQESGTIEAVIANGWNVLEEVRILARELRGTEDAWELISSVWAEMLCFAAYNCQQCHHAKMLRQGGEIITHAWLLLSHKTDKLKTTKYTGRNREIE